MGRKRKYHTKEELLEANRKKRMRWYWKNREKVLEEAKKKYKEKMRKSR